MAAVMPRGYRSVNEYRFHEEHAEAIIRTTSYHYRDFFRSVIWFPPRKHVDIRLSMAAPFQRTSSRGLGSLDRLPLELLHFCGDFSGFVSLLTWNRCCFKCLQHAPETQVQTLAAVRRHFHLAKAELRQLRSFKTLPGTYGDFMNESTYKSQITVTSVHQAMLVSGQQPRAQSAVSGRKQKNLNFMSSCALPYYDRQTDRVEHGISCAGCQLALEKGIIGSRGEKWEFEARNKIYARDAFLEHFRWCEQAQLLWSSSDEEGTSITKDDKDVVNFQTVRQHIAARLSSVALSTKYLNMKPPERGRFHGHPNVDFTISMRLQFTNCASVLTPPQPLQAGSCISKVPLD
ncbi:hypothetical protein E4U38_003653 [Claviceps purpurea]|nr:hypothetical protein E4U38_003653 [Claviceps purpurea]